MKKIEKILCATCGAKLRIFSVPDSMDCPNGCKYILNSMKPEPLIEEIKEKAKEDKRSFNKIIYKLLYDYLPDYIDEKHPKGKDKLRGVSTVEITMFLIWADKKLKEK